MEPYKDSFYLRSLTDDFVFCPKCGTKNQFRISSSGTELNYFCDRCSERLNDFWEEAYTGQLETVICEACQQPTFEEMKYCISCGSLQRMVARKRAREISRELGGSDLRDDVLAVTTGRGPFGFGKNMTGRLLLMILIITIIFLAGLGILIFYLLQLLGV